MTGFSLMPLLPEIFLALSGMVLLLAGAFRASPNVILWAATGALAIALILLLGMDWHPEIILNGMFGFDRFAGFMKAVILGGLIAALALSARYLQEEDIARFEYPVLVLLAGTGMMLMVSASNLLSLYMSLELQSLSLYVLAAFRRNSLRSSEAGIKYFILGAVSSGMLLFGISLVYGFTGSLDYGAIRTSVMVLQGAPPGLIFGLVFILAGLAFKISAAPFHMWTPDVYHGAPTGVTALFALVPKLAAMGLLMRLLFGPFATMADQWTQVLWFASAASMIVGAFAAVAQENIKRLMAYSSIGNIGYALIGLVAVTERGAAAVLVYLLIYMAATAGVFAVILSMRRGGQAVETISDLKGLSATRPALAYGMAVLMFSLSGIPPAAGFFGKLLIFQAAMAKDLYILAVLGVLSSVVAAYYYLRIVKVMFFDEVGAKLDSGMPPTRRAVLLLSVLFTLLFILDPSLVIGAAQDAAAFFFAG